MSYPDLEETVARLRRIMDDLDRAMFPLPIGPRIIELAAEFHESFDALDFYFLRKHFPLPAPTDEELEADAADLACSEPRDED